MSTLGRSSVLLMACLLLRTTASAQSPAEPLADGPPPVTELLIHDARWIPAVQGAVPDGAVAHGRERDGGPQYICRTIFEGGVHLGKVSSESPGCVIVVGDRAVVRRSYQVLTERVGPRSSDTDPRGLTPNRWGRTESVLDTIKRRRAESPRSKKILND
jgi:hypothetical protein